MTKKRVILALKWFVLACVLTWLEYFWVMMVLPWIWVEIYQGSVLLMFLIMMTVVGCLPLIGWAYLVCLVGWFGFCCWLGVYTALFD
jgi:hypothetical protein